MTDVNDWLSRSRLRLDASKTQMIWLGSSQQLDKIDISSTRIMSTRVPVSDTVRDLGVIIGRLVAAYNYGGSSCCRLSLWLLSAAATALGRTVAIGSRRRGSCHAFISCLLDYYNSLLTGVNDGLLQQLQSVQDAAARLVTSTQRREHITPALRQLHWLSVRQRIHYNLATLVFRALSFGPGLGRRRRRIYLSQIHIYIKLQTNTC